MTKQETYDYLTAHGVAYEAMEHGAVFNMAEAAQLALPHPEAEAKNLSSAMIRNRPIICFACAAISAWT